LLQLISNFFQDLDIQKVVETEKMTERQLQEVKQHKEEHDKLKHTTSSTKQERNKMLESQGATDKAKIEGIINNHIKTIADNTTGFAESLYNREKNHLIQK